MTTADHRFDTIEYRRRILAALETLKILDPLGPRDSVYEALCLVRAALETQRRLYRAAAKRCQRQGGVAAKDPLMKARKVPVDVLAGVERTLAAALKTLTAHGDPR
ncbi:MAG: hypothetical protein F4090_07175 [Nitrospira sp. SB0672_bin_25]|nr:hypothetical protein [Nitrospira sp. SB0672_bin_25]